MIYVIPLVMLIFSAFFSGTEIAFVSANRLKIQLKQVQGEKFGHLLTRFVQNAPRVITTLLVGNALALVMWGIYFGEIIRPVIQHYLLLGGLNPESEFLVLIPETIISTLIILMLGEYIPKALFRINPDKMMGLVGPILNFFYLLFYPLVSITNSSTSFILNKISKSTVKQEEWVVSKKDLDHFIKETLSEAEGTPVHEIDREMFNNALDFNKIRARDCMVPRTEIVAVSQETSIEALRKLFVETELSKIIIYNENLDNVTGYVHSSSLFKNPTRIEEVLQSVLVVPDSMPGHVLLTEFTRNRKSVALVIDEFGGTEGLVTTEDLVEEVFGEIEDEHDMPEDSVLLKKQTGPNTWLFNARLEVYEINREFGLNLPEEGDYSTLAGLVITLAETIPNANDAFMVGDYRILVLDRSENRINTIKVEKVV